MNYKLYCHGWSFPFGKGKSIEFESPNDLEAIKFMVETVEKLGIQYRQYVLGRFNPNELIFSSFIGQIDSQLNEIEGEKPYELSTVTRYHS